MTTTEGRIFEVLDSAQVAVWPVRIMWLALPAIFRLGFGSATADLDATGVLGLEILAWFVWFVGMVATAVSHPLALTIIRTLAPVPVTSLLVASGLQGDLPLTTMLVCGYSAVVMLAIFLPAFGDPMVNGSAYGPERRLALRPPGFVVVGAIPLVWVTMFTLLASGFALAATDHLLFAIPLIFMGAAATYAGIKSLHQLSQRWLVFVPAGFVIHDRLLLTEPVLIPRKVIDNLGLVGFDHGDEKWKRGNGDGIESVDATGGAAGLVVEVNTSADISLAMKGRGSSREATTRSIRFSPTLPGKVLSEARIRGIRVGAPKPPSSPTVE